MQSKFVFILLFTFTAFFSKAQYLKKGMLLLDLSGDFTTFESTVDQGIPTYTKAYTMTPVLGIGLRISNQLYGYLNLGYGFGKDSTRQGYIHPRYYGQEFPVAEMIKKSIPILGFGFKKFFHLGETPFFFSTDIGANLAMGKLDGTLVYAEPRGSQTVLVVLTSQGQQTSISAGITPGLAFFSKSGWFVDLGIGFIGYSFQSRNIKYTDGFDDTSTQSSFRIDLSAAAIKLRVGTMF
jgi:hypothetical protein